MLLMKSCPRCRGDLSLTLERVLACLQCGHEVPQEAAREMIAARLAARAARAVPAARAA
jgi:hypothetical protein